MFTDRAVNDGRNVQADEIASEVLGRVHRRQERERAFVGIAVAFVIDVIKNEAIYSHRPKPRNCDLSDLPGLLRSARQPRWRHREDQELTDPIGDALLELHGPNRSQPVVVRGGGEDGESGQSDATAE